MNNSPSTLAGSVALVTGGGTGIGRAVCEALAAADARAIVVNYSRSVDDAEATVAAIQNAGCQAVAIKADVANRDEVEAMIADTLSRFGTLDVLVNNAGVTRLIPHRDLDAVTDEDWDAMLGVNVRGAFNCVRAAAPALKASRGAVVNVASTAGHRASGTSIPYSVSKAGMLQLTRLLAGALAPEVRVNSVSPGAVDSRWLDELLGAAAATENAEREASVTPLGRIARPSDVAQAVLGLLTSEFVTGQDLIVDGGKHLLY
ncbi:MAG: hypothetical protein QOI02_1241 [Actinomycetota bacterium]|nr:hypothetical protein [Actinomycetota bacterium]